MYSQTQASNITTVVGVIMFILNHYHINISNEEVTQFIGAILVVGGIAWNWYHRFSKGDINLAGVRK